MRLLRLLLVLACFSKVLFAADSPFSGTWKLDPSKSHMTPPILKSSTARVDADEENFKLSQDFVDDKGQTMTVTFEAKFDGKNYPVTGDPDIDSVSLRRITDHRIKATFKKAGKVGSISDITVSKDGKTTRLAYTDYIEGKTRKGSAIYEKQ